MQGQTHESALLVFRLLKQLIINKLQDNQSRLAIPVKSSCHDGENATRFHRNRGTNTSESQNHYGKNAAFCFAARIVFKDIMQKS